MTKTDSDERQLQDDDLYSIVSTALNEARTRCLTSEEIAALRYVCNVPEPKPYPHQYSMHI